MRTIAIFGASGKTGKPFTQLALKAGYNIKTLVRTPEKLGLQDPNLQVIQGDLTNPAQVEQAIQGADVIVSFIGSAKNSPRDIKVVATENIMSAMQKNNVKRFIRIASAPFGVLADGDKPKFGQKLMSSMMKTMMGSVVQDELQSVNLLTSSKLDWTIVRAPMLKDGPAVGTYHTGHLGIDAGSGITRSDLVTFMLEEVKNNQYIHQLPLVSN